MREDNRIRLFILDRSPQMMVKLLSFFEKKTDIIVVEANQDVHAFMDESRRFEMKELMDELRPDVIIVDLRHPIKSELLWISKIKEMTFVPVVAFTSIELSKKETADFGFNYAVHRPEFGDLDAESKAMNVLLYHVRNAARADRALESSFDKDAFRIKTPSPTITTHSSDTRLVAIGASAGGTEAISKVVSAFPANMPGILIVQHITKGFAEVFAQHLRKVSARPAKVASDGDIVGPNMMYVAPDEKHMEIRRSGTKYIIRCRSGERISGHIPSVNAMFTSVAKHAGAAAVGAILTGMGKDGAEGLLEMRRAGAYTIGQDEASCLVYGMPRAAYEMDAVQTQLPLDDIAREIVSKVHGK